MNRTPPPQVREALRAEVGFGCPVVGCGVPYLEWHHFDPPWAEREHHEPGGMIAMCRVHHIQADHGGWNREELRKLKETGRDRASSLQGRFQWMRRQLVSRLGGNFYFEIETDVVINGKPAVWFERDEGGYLLLNLDIPTGGGQRLRLENNFWTAAGDELDLECPPSGKELRARYPGGDYIHLRFREIADPASFEARYHIAPHRNLSDMFPLATLEIAMKIGDHLDFDAERTTLGGGGGGGLIITNSWFGRSKTGLDLWSRVPPDQA